MLIYGSSYWKSVINLDMLAEKGAIAMKDLDLFQFADTPEEAFEMLKAGAPGGHAAPGRVGTRACLPAGGRPREPAPDAQTLLGPDIAKTR